MVYLVGLTGSIGMGKSTVAEMFRRAGLAVWDADAAVHALYAPGGEAVASVAGRFPAALSPEGGIDREALAREVLGDRAAIRALEQIVHPLVGDHRQGFLAEADAAGHELVVVDVPLLFETGGAARMDYVVAVSAPAAAQRRRVLERPGMSAAKLDAILARQTPDAEKRRRADHVIDTGCPLAETEVDIEELVVELRRRAKQKRGGG